MGPSRRTFLDFVLVCGSALCVPVVIGLLTLWILNSWCDVSLASVGTTRVRHILWGSIMESSLTTIRAEGGILYVDSRWVARRNLPPYLFKEPMVKTWEPSASRSIASANWWRRKAFFWSRSPGVYFAASAPFWAFILPLSIFPVLGIRRLRAVRRAIALAKQKICPGCGYDMRATPDQCPECGHVVQKPSLSDVSHLEQVEMDLETDETDESRTDDPQAESTPAVPDEPSLEAAASVGDDTETSPASHPADKPG